VPAVETVQVEMPAMGESVTEGTVLDWLKEEGDRVEEGESLVEVSTDKIDAEVPSPAAGTLTKILKGPDEVVKIGEALAELEPGGNGAGDGSGAAPSMARAAGEGDADIGDDADAATLQAEYRGDDAVQSGDGDGGPAGEPVELVMPEMGESVTEGTVLEWLKEPGDDVAEGDRSSRSRPTRSTPRSPPRSPASCSRRSSSRMTWSRSVRRWRGYRRG